MSEHQHPDHYAGTIPAIDAIRAALTPEEFRGFLKGNVLKYMWRAGKKGPPLGDALKASDYQAWWVEELKKEAGQ
ncbi:DUF3310 domain-containing protein [Deinococcus sp. Leaf326]|uniref:DUF3310 domain-containing protein n=1 Tax=Deinococcus sp. Leaf326 TaxID=1736338 RepID=UPI0006FF71E7|nr:DUF3310 domain-containing protein [Deinococcus sp. Leaf326]KQR22904.1 hypothetical protein ASF71_06975 [Deinococcus sp. Leaf326]